MNAKQTYFTVRAFMEEHTRWMPASLRSWLGFLLTLLPFYALDNLVLPAILTVVPPYIVFPLMFIALLLAVVVVAKTWMHIWGWIICGYLIALLVSALYGSHLSDRDDNTAWVWYVLSCGGLWLPLAIGWLFMRRDKGKKKPDDNSVADRDQS